MNRLFIFFIFIIVSIATANDIFLISDKNNYATIVKSPKIYYTSKQSSGLNIFYKSDVEENGIRVKEGLGNTLIDWENILQVDILKQDTKNTFFEANILNTNSKNISVNLLKPEGTLEATTELGIFSIDFKKIKSIDRIDLKHHYLKGELLAISQYSFMDKKELPKSVNIKDENSLLEFTSKILILKKDELKVQHFKQYIIIHYEKIHPEWRVKKYGEAVVIDTSTMKYTAFRLSRA